LSARTFGDGHDICRSALQRLSAALHHRPPRLGWAQALPQDRIIIRKDASGSLLDPSSVERMDAFLRGRATPQRLILQFRTGPEYDPLAMGADEALAARLGEEHRQTMHAFRERSTRQRGAATAVVAELLPLPLAVVETDAAGLPLLIDDPDVQVIYQDVVFRQFLHETLPQINAAAAHAAGATGSGQAVAVLDIGVQRGHPMFSGKLVGEACFASSNQGHPGCPSGHAYGSTSAGAGETCTGHVACEHGTHVAAIAIGSQQTTTQGPVVKGVAYAGNLVSIRVAALSDALVDCGGGTCDVYRLTDTAPALAHVYSNRSALNIAAVNMSYGEYGPHFGFCGNHYGDLAQQVDLLAGAGVAVVAASGNRGHESTWAGTLAAPACIENVISVASVDKVGAFTSYSNASSVLDLLAPGGHGNIGIPILWPCSSPHQCVLSAITGSGHDYKHGTSMAAPHVAGTIAALRTIWPNSHASVGALIEHLKDTGLGVTFMQGNNGYTRPLLQLDAALAKPTAPGLVTVEPQQCYGSNWVYWGASTGTLSHYQVQGSHADDFSNPFDLSIGASTFVAIDVTGTTWIRVRACHGPSCTRWRHSSTTATYTAGCV
jgi:subtilisin family serine protease